MSEILNAIRFANYRKSDDEKVCPDCFFSDVGECDLWDFHFANNYKCINWGTLDDFGAGIIAEVT